MKIAVDANVLLRAALGDEAVQSAAAREVLRSAEVVAVGIHCPCEFAWVLSRSYEVPSSGIAAAIRELVRARNVVTSRPAVEAGLAMLAVESDFADGSSPSKTRGPGARRSFRSTAGR